MKNLMKNLMIVLAAIIIMLPINSLAATPTQVKEAGYTISYKNGTYTNFVELKLTARKGYTIYYTTNGKTPTIKSGKVKQKKSVKIGVDDTTKIKVKAVKKTKAIKTSHVKKAKTKTYTYKVKKADWVKVNNTNSTVNKNTKIKLTAKNGYTLYYTTNGKTPTTKSSKISSKKTKTITISKNTTIKVVGYKYNTLVKKSNKNKFSTVVKTLKYKVKSTNNDDKDDDKKDDDDKKEVFDSKNYTKYFTLSNDGSDGKRYIDYINLVLKTKGDYQIKTDCYWETSAGSYERNSNKLLKGSVNMNVDGMDSSFTVYVYDKNGNQLGSKKFKYNIFDSSLGGRRGSEYVGYEPIHGVVYNYTFKKPEGVNVRYKISEGTTQVITKDVETVSIGPAYAIIWQYYNETGESAVYGDVSSGLKF